VADRHLCVALGHPLGGTLRSGLGIQHDNDGMAMMTLRITRSTAWSFFALDLTVYS
jgi:hypothetical protein